MARVNGHLICGSKKLEQAMEGPCLPLVVRNLPVPHRIHISPKTAKFLSADCSIFFCVSSEMPFFGVDGAGMPSTRVAAADVTAT